MHRRVALILCILCMVPALAGCQQMATKDFGSTTKIDLPANEKLEEITWKSSDLWYLTRPMREGEEPETHVFQEQSTFRVLEGKVIITEHKEE